jgi:hypothetical protein
VIVGREVLDDFGVVHRGPDRRTAAQAAECAVVRAATAAEAHSAAGDGHGRADHQIGGGDRVGAQVYPWLGLRASWTAGSARALVSRSSACGRAARALRKYCRAAAFDGNTTRSYERDADNTVMTRRPLGLVHE